MSVQSRHVERKLRKAAMNHRCEGCPEMISKGWDYVEDCLKQRYGYQPHNIKTLATKRWHLGCAPVIRSEAQALFD